jgi:L-malate glycosyltransferase
VKIDQLIHTLSYGDAISGETLALQRAFKESNIQSDIYCLNIHDRYRNVAFDISKFVVANTVILHYSIGSPLNDIYLNSATKKVMIYHNITPAKWFKRINNKVATDIEQGLADLKRIATASDIVIADSAYNAEELKKIGINSTILELPIDPARWQVIPNNGIMNLLRKDNTINLLHVGRLAPNKCIEDILKIFYFFHHKIQPNSILWLIGIDIDTELYSYSLKQLAIELGIANSVRFVGSVADEELIAWYQCSSVYICMSEHEGFCLPVVEAMNFNLPVIAYSATAVADTVGDSAILVNKKKHAEIAELVNIILNDKKLRSTMQQRGVERVKVLSYEKFQKKVQEIFSL